MGKRLVVLVLALILCLGLFVGCGQREDGPLLFAPPCPYADALLSQLPDYRLKSNLANPVSCLTGGSCALRLEIQNDPDTLARQGLTFLPLGLVTVGFAIDESRTDARPATWQALLDSDLTVGFSHSLGTQINRRAILAALAHGLRGDRDTALSYLQALERRDRLTLGEDGCDVLLCFDADAAALLRQGRPLTLVIPADGTLSYAWGLLGRAPLPRISEDSLLQAGLRLPDGRCGAGYPDEEAYAAASRFSDYGQFHRITRNATRDLRRLVFHARYFNSADGRENILLITTTVILILIWAMTALHRSNQRTLTRWIWLITGLTVGWLMLSMLKYMLGGHNLLDRMLWYSYYIFLMALPLAALYMAAVVDQVRPDSACPRWFFPFIAVYLLLLAVIFTNDLHQLVFRFPDPALWFDRYTYGPAYYLIFAFTLLTFLLSIVLLLMKTRRSPRRFAWVWPGTVAVLLVAFNVGYVLRVPICVDSNLTQVFCLFSVLFVEALLHCGFLPMNLGYRQLFASSPLQMQLLDQTGAARLTSVGAEPLTEAQKQALLDQPGAAVPKAGDLVLHSFPIHGGTVVWQEDLSRIHSLQRQLQASIDSIAKANTLLQQEQAVRRKRITSDVQEQLFDKLEADLQEESRALSDMIRQLPSGPQRSRRISCIPLLLCHIKRRCNLFFLSQEGEQMSSNELAMYLDELSEFAGYAQLRALVRCGISGELPVSHVTLCYDFYFSMLRWSLEQGPAALIGKIESRDDGLQFSVVTACSDRPLEFSATFRHALEQLGAAVNHRTVEDRESLVLVLPRKGGNAP